MGVGRTVSVALMQFDWRQQYRVGVIEIRLCQFVDDVCGGVKLRVEKLFVDSLGHVDQLHSCATHTRPDRIKFENLTEG